MHLITLFTILIFSKMTYALPLSFDCSYESFSDDSGNHKVENDFDLKFVLDADSEKAYMVGNNGAADVIYLINPSGESISFVEITPSQNVMTTTISPISGESVHSRNSVLLGEMIPSQYYGKCEIK